MLTAIAVFLSLAALGVLAMFASYSIKDRDRKVVTHNVGMLALGLGAALSFACGAAVMSGSLIVGIAAAIATLAFLGLILAPDVRKAIAGGKGNEDQ